MLCGGGGDRSGRHPAVDSQVPRCAGGDSEAPSAKGPAGPSEPPSLHEALAVERGNNAILAHNVEALKALSLHLAAQLQQVNRQLELQEEKHALALLKQQLNGGGRESAAAGLSAEGGGSALRATSELAPSARNETCDEGALMRIAALEAALRTKDDVIHRLRTHITESEAEADRRYRELQIAKDAVILRLTREVAATKRILTADIRHHLSGNR